MAAATLEEVFSALRDGKMVVMVAEEREDAEGDLVMAAEKITPDDINFMAREGATTGISAGDRARVISVVSFEESRHDDIVMPGHVLPLMALSGGVMMRIGRAEGAVDLVRSAGMSPAAALCTMLCDDGD